MNFLKSEFGGELPRLYEPWDQGGTWIELLDEFNDRNQEVYRYVLLAIFIFLSPFYADYLLYV